MTQLPSAFENLPSVMAFVKEFGRAIALSGMCGVKDEESGMVIAMECLIKRKSPREIGLEMTSRFNLMNGKLSLKSEAMLADFHEARGKSKIVSRTPDLAEIELSRDGKTDRFALTWDECQLETFPYAGKESEIIEKLAAGKKPKLKPKYATPRSRMQMLWARVVSDAVRSVAPEVTNGAYTPEEIGDIIEADTGRSVPLVEETAEVVAVAKLPDLVDKKQQDDRQQWSERLAEHTAISSQIEQIKDLMIKLEVPHETQQAALAKRGASAFHSLTFDAAAELLGTLQEKWAAFEATRTEIRNDEPCTALQVAAIKEQISVIAQLGDGEIGNKIKAKLVASGMNTLADLSVVEADMALTALKAKQMQMFFDASLYGHTPKN